MCDIFPIVVLMRKSEDGGRQMLNETEECENGGQMTEKEDEGPIKETGFQSFTVPKSSLVPSSMNSPREDLIEERKLKPHAAWRVINMVLPYATRILTHLCL